MFRIYIDLTSYRSGKALGFNNYVKYLLEGFSSIRNDAFDITVCVPFDRKGDLLRANKNLKFIHYSEKSIFARLWTHHVYPLFLRRSFDAFLFPANFLPLFPPQNSVLVVHDLGYLKNSSDFSFSQLAYRWIFQRLSIIRANKVLSISKSTASEIFKVFGRQTVVVENPVRPLSTSADNDKLILCASSLARFKNVSAAYLATLMFCDHHKEYKAVFIGNWSPAEFPSGYIDERVKLLGYVSSEERDNLVSRAEIVLAPSTYEGFGLPYAEALISGKKLVCCDIPIAREIVGDKAFLIPFPFGALEIVRALTLAAASNGQVDRMCLARLRLRFSPGEVAKRYLKQLGFASAEQESGNPPLG